MASYRETELPHLPEEIKEEILSFLPVKSLLRSSSVSRSWRRLIGSERFIKTHLKKSRENRTLAHHRIIFEPPDWKTYTLNQCFLHSLMNDAIPTTSPFDYSLKALTEEDSYIMGCCNGMVCVRYMYGGNFALWNPATRIVTRLPEIEPYSDSINSFSGFGWDESSGAYKVFANMFNRYGRNTAKIYSSDTNSWTPVRLPVYLDGEWRFGPIVRGYFHIYVTGRGEGDGGGEAFEIFRLDLKSKVFGKVEHPLKLEAGVYVLGCVWLCSIENRLSMVHIAEMRRIDVWVMKEYGIKNSWCKVMAVPLPPERIRSRSFAVLLGVGPNGEILMTVGSVFFAYDPKKNVLLQVKEIEGVHLSGELYLYFENLGSAFPKQERMLQP